MALSIGLAIYDLTVRELDLSTTAKQSQYAIFAADTGVECALYWDNKYTTDQSAFATSSQSSPPSSGISCDSVDIAAQPWSVVSSASAATTTFWLSDVGSGQCVLVTVAKVGSPARTTVTSHGYTGASGANCATASGGVQLERALQVTY